MSARGKDVRVEIDADMHTKLSIMAEFEGLEISALCASLVEKTIAGEWHRYERVVARANEIADANAETEGGLAAGFVYVIRIGNRYKIGKSADWRKRISSAMFSEPPEVICVIETGDRHQLERALHAEFASVRCHGEWFLLTEQHVTDLRRTSGSIPLE